MLGGASQEIPSESQNGAKYRTICADCNSYLGRNFDASLNNFALDVARFLKSPLIIPERANFQVQPQKLMKALLGHLVAAKVDIECTHFDEMAIEYVLDVGAKLPESIEIFYWIYPHDCFVTIRDFALFTPRGTYQKPAMFQVMKYFPVAYLCTEVDEYAGLPRLSTYRDCDLEDTAELAIDFRVFFDAFWPEAPTSDGNVMFGGQSAMNSHHAIPKKSRN